SFFLSYYHHTHPALHSFPTRRSSDLPSVAAAGALKTATSDFRITEFQHVVNKSSAGKANIEKAMARQLDLFKASQKRYEPLVSRDRKSTRLNSSHSQISYAVFCLKKK